MIILLFIMYSFDMVFQTVLSSKISLTDAAFICLFFHEQFQYELSFCLTHKIEMDVWCKDTFFLHEQIEYALSYDLFGGICMVSFNMDFQNTCVAKLGWTKRANIILFSLMESFKMSFQTIFPVKLG